MRHGTEVLYPHPFGMGLAASRTHSDQGLPLSETPVRQRELGRKLITGINHHMRVQWHDRFDVLGCHKVFHNLNLASRMNGLNATLKGIHLGHLKWTLETFLKAYFERDDVVLRLRPSYFPFTEPSVEVDVGYSLVNGKRVIGGSEGWMEVLGSGMVNRKVIEAGGLDPDEWQGFAFGTGVDRLAMLKYGMDDLRAFFDGDLRWLNHYGFAALDVPTLSGGVGA